MARPLQLMGVRKFLVIDSVANCAVKNFARKPSSPYTKKRGIIYRKLNQSLAKIAFLRQTANQYR